LAIVRPGSVPGIGPEFPPGRPGHQRSRRRAAADSGVAVGTVQRAYALLAEEGLIRTVKGRGTFVVGR
jgi:DNA-binding transcriptional regulator YhcF (GntR family)